MVQTIRQTLGYATGDTSRPIRRRDARLLNGDQVGGVQVLLDVPTGWTFPNGIVDGATVRNAAKDAVKPGAVDCSITIPAGQIVTRSNGYIDFSGATDRGAVANIPAEAAMAPYFASSNRYISFGLTVKLPTEADFNATTTPLRLLTFGTTATGYVSGVNPFEVAMLTAAGSKVIRIYRQKGSAVGSADLWTFTLPVGSAVFGSKVLIHFARTAAGQQATLYWSGGTIIGASAGTNDNAANTQNFAASIGYIGLSAAGWGSAGGFQTDASNWKFGRFWLELPDVTGRDPQAVAAADAARILARTDFN